MEKLYKYDEHIKNISKNIEKKHKKYIENVEKNKSNNDLAKLHNGLIKNKRNVVKIIYNDLLKYSKSNNLYDKEHVSNDLKACSFYLGIK